MGKRLRTYLKQQMVTKQMETINDNNEQQSQQQQPTHIFFFPNNKTKKITTHGYRSRKSVFPNR